MTNGNDNACGYGFANERSSYESLGLTKREYFAAMAMQGLCANSIPGNHHKPEVLCKDAVEYADTLIKELNK